ncbi:MAG: glucosyl-3-phosphoglycerate synthase [Acidimicrobiia bacterium]|nr:glucosyl-3-phosphoglycerate synthase [Acidimicrobiia bacterium]
MPTDADELAAIKAAQHTRISVCLPARDEEATVGHIVATVRRNLIERVQIVDEIVVVDDGSQDATAEAARWEGAIVHSAEEVLPSMSAGSGKGNALWLSLYATTGDIICWIDADVRNFRSEFVTRLVEPLLVEPDVGFVKGYYRRPLFGLPNGGGRVTELVARPLLSALFPHLAHIVQPLGGEYAGRRTLLDTLPFVEGYGVELGLLIDIAAAFGVNAIAQADLRVREHRNRPIEELAPQAMEILITALRRAGVGRSDLSATLVRFDEEYEKLLVPVETRERPPMLTIPEYREKFDREQTA